MRKTTKPCSLGPRHKWQLIRNQIVQSGGPITVRISKRGIYRCNCGETKQGEPGHDLS